MDKHRQAILRGAGFGLAAAVLFGLSVPMSKLLLQDVQASVLSGLYYFGAGIGLSCWQMLSRARSASRATRSERPLTRQDLPWFVAAVLVGGVAGGLLGMWGLRTTPASGASLLLNSELTFSALLAWILFSERANLRVVLGMIAISLGAVALSVGESSSLNFAPGAWCIIAACFCWGLDNNLTRKISAADPVQIISIKGLVAGVLNLLVGFCAGGRLPALPTTLMAMTLGFFAIGVSLVLFTLSLRYVGAARGTAYFSVSPFVGAVASVVLLHDPVNAGFLTAAALMAVGLFLNLTEQAPPAVAPDTPPISNLSI